MRDALGNPVLLYTGKENFLLRLVQMDEPGALRIDSGSESVDVQNLLTGSDNFRCQLLQGGTVVAIVEIKQQARPARRRSAVLRAKADATFADIIDSCKLVWVGAASDADQEMGGELFAVSMSSFHAKREA